MKIIQVCPIFPPPSPKSFGSGVVSVVYDLSRELLKRGHEVSVYTSAVLDRSSKIKHISNPTIIEEIEVYYFPYVASYYTFFVTPSIMPAIRKNIRNFDIIHLHDFRTFQSIVTHHYAKQYGIPYVLQAHGSLVTYFQKGTVKRIFDRLWGYKILKDASKVIALTKTEAEQYRSMGVSEEKIEIMPNGIDLSEFDNLPERGEFRKKYSLNDDQKLILYLGRIHKTKGLDLLVKAFAELSMHLNNIELVIVGPVDGYLPSLKKLIADLGISDKVLYTGLLYGEEKLKACVDADVYVLPSAYETFPVAVLEACACGTPVIITDRCGIADVIDGQAGLVVPYDKDQLADALSHMLSDDKMRRGFGERGKLLIQEQFAWPKITAQVESIYENCVSSGRCGEGIHL